MATLEKPKQKKKKVKSSSKQEVTYEKRTLDDEICDLDINFAEINFNEPSTSTVQDGVDPNKTEIEETASNVHENTVTEQELLNSSILNNDNQIPEAPIENQLTPTINNDLFLEETSLEFINIHTEELPIQSIATSSKEQEDVVPSAPAFEVPVETNLYPKLSEIGFQEQIHQFNVSKHHDLSTKTTVSDISSIRPLSLEEMNELYFNPYLPNAIAFEDEFVNKELNEEFSYHRHPLYELLIKYQKSRQNLKVNQVDINDLRINCQKHFNSAWTTHSAVAKGEATCSDRKLCKAFQNYEYATLNNTTVEQIKNELKSLLELSGFTYSKNSYMSAICKLQIENRIRDVLNTFPCDETSPIALTDNPAVNLYEVRLCLSILFSFLRKPNMDSIVISDVKTWILALAALQLRYATWQDHLFLLYHILRCPLEISKWATCCIQIPLQQIDTYSNSPFESQAIHHCLTLLMALLQPIKKRKEFLGKIKKELIDPIQENLWVLVDSDGEDMVEENENGPRENDMNAVLKQIPFQKLFSCITCAIPKEDGYYVNSNAISGLHLLKSIVFSTRLVEILGQGLKTYEDERYRQFGKRLARMIRHILQYISEMHDIFVASVQNGEADIRNRIQLEYNFLVLRACFYIYNSKQTGTWQYLSGLPFRFLSKITLFKLYYAFHAGYDYEIVEDLNTNFAEMCNTADFWNTFATNSIDIQSEDLYFLLQVFASMACSREEQDFDFIMTVTSGLYQIGYLNEITKETCYKTVKDLIGSIAMKFPNIISGLIQRLKTDVSKIASYNSYLIKALPLDMWKPTVQDLEIIAAWLLNFSFESFENQTARIIFNRLNWDFGTDGSLFLSYDVHVRTACLISEVSTKHVPETIGLSEISITSLVKNQTSRTQFSNWCWNLISRLRLHCMDQSRNIVCGFLNNPSDYLQRIPELEDTQILCQGVNESRPIAVYMSLLISLIGHSVPEICHRGLEHIKLLLNDSRHTIVIRSLELIAPIFLECPDSLSSCDKFQTILSQLLNDKSYQKYTKDFVILQTQKPVLILFGNMIQHQITNYVHYGLQSPTMLINLWFQCLTYNKSWYTNPNHIYIIDVMTRIAFQFPDAWHCLKDKLQPLLKDTEIIKQQQSYGLLNLIGGSASGSFNGLAQPSVNTPWISLISLEIEFECIELQKGIWPEFLRQIYENSRKMSMDSILKKVTSLTGTAHFSANLLVMNKLSSLIVLCNVENPLLPIFCQQFFTLYLARIPVAPNDQRFYETFGVSDKFYESNLTQLKKVKKKLQEAVEYHSENSLKENDSAQFHNACLKIFKAYLLWLEETQINKMHSNSVNTSIIESHKLKVIFQGNRSYWSEFIDSRSIRKQQINESNEWAKIIQRPINTIKQSPSLISCTDVTNPKQCIAERLESYDQPQSPPKLFDIRSNPPMSKPYLTSSTRNVFQKNFKEISDYAKKFNDLINEHKQLDQTYLNLLQCMYKNENHCVRKRMTCGPNCTGSASILIQYQDSKLDMKVLEKIEYNKRLFENVSKQELAVPKNEIVTAVTLILDATQYLADSYSRMKDGTVPNNPKQMGNISSNGITLFYEMIQCMKEHIMNCPISEEVCNYCVDKLGVFVRDNHDVEGFHLLETALNRPDLINLIGELFCPTLSPPPYFNNMYKVMIDSHFKKCSEHTIFVLFSKFDVLNWLNYFKPPRSEVSNLLRLTLKGLECWNQPHLGLIQGLLRRHLVHIFEHNFPLHCLETLEQSLLEISERNFNPDVLHDLLNALYQKADCGAFPADPTADTKKVMIKFASKQTLLSYEILSDITKSISIHFHTQRLQHGLHGLYPKHASYIKVIRILVGTISYAYTNVCVVTYPSILIENLINMLWTNLYQIFSPWIIPYCLTENNAANWIQQLSTNQIMQPWSQKYVEDASTFLQLYIQNIVYILENISGSHIILGHVLHQYDVAFVNAAIPKHVYDPLHNELLNLPWNLFKPNTIHIDMFNRILQQFLPDFHAFIGHIFLKIDWTAWFAQSGSTEKSLAAVLQIFVRLAQEPEIVECKEMVRLLDDALKYPWELIPLQELESIFDWLILSADPIIILKHQSKIRPVDISLLNLLTIISCFGSNPVPLQSVTSIYAKRLLYVRMVTRLLRACGTKYQQLLSGIEGGKSFNIAISELLLLIENATKNENDELRECHTTSLLMELLGSLPSQSEFTARLTVNAITHWQLKSSPNNITLSSILTVLNSYQVYSFNVCLLVELTISRCLKQPETGDVLKLIDWNVIADRMVGFTSVDVSHLINNDLLLCTHLFLILKLRSFETQGDKIVLLQNVFEYLEKYKTKETSEASWFLLIGLFVEIGLKNLEGAASFLLLLARYLLNNVAQSEGWTDGILGAIGLKRDTVSNSKRMLSRCLACLILSFYIDNSMDAYKISAEYKQALQELKTSISSKKYAELRNQVLQVISQLERAQEAKEDESSVNVAAIIRLFYREHYLDSVESAWQI